MKSARVSLAVFQQPGDTDHNCFSGDVENFALSNKEIHTLSLACLQRHRAFKQQYSVLRFGRPDGWSEEFAQERHPLFYLEVSQSRRLSNLFKGMERFNNRKWETFMLSMMIDRHAYSSLLKSRGIRE